MRIKQTAAWIVVLALGTSACQPVPGETPISTMDVLTARVTSALRALAPQMQECAAELPDTGLVLLDSAETAPGVDLTLRWGDSPAPQGYAAVVGQEELAIVAHPDNPISSLAPADLRAIYQGTMTEWDDSGSFIAAWAYPNGDDTLRVFESAVMGSESVNRHYVGTVPEPGAMVETISGDPSAVGFIPRRWLNESVKAIEIEGIPPEQFRAPVLAISEDEPQDTPRAWLICLQDALK